MDRAKEPRRAEISRDWSIEEQRRLAHQQFLWDARATLYTSVVVSLQERKSLVEALSDKIHAHQRSADAAEDKQLFAELDAALQDVRTEAGLAPRRSGVQQDVPHVSRLESRHIVAAYVETLALPPDLQVGIALLASEEAVRAYDGYVAATAAPDLFRGSEPAAWVGALKMSHRALDDLTIALKQDLQLLPHMTQENR